MLFRADDPSNFDKPTLEAIWRPCDHKCILSGTAAWEFHHVWGRGQDFGVKPDDERRRLFSSPYNAFPISRQSHDNCPILNDTDMRNALTTFVMSKVQEAYALRHVYTPTDDDCLFLSLIGRM